MFTWNFLGKKYPDWQCMKSLNLPKYLLHSFCICTVLTANMGNDNPWTSCFHEAQVVEIYGGEWMMPWEWLKEALHFFLSYLELLFMSFIDKLWKITWPRGFKNTWFISAYLIYHYLQSSPLLGELNLLSLFSPKKCV